MAERGCEVEVGRLIAHACGRRQAHHCGRCGRDICARHFDTEKGACQVCTGALAPSAAQIRLSDLGDPLDFAPEVYAAFQRRAGAPQDELTGVDS